MKPRRMKIESTGAERLGCQRRYWWYKVKFFLPTP
jgi:hypothetical protein